ncbi:farnesol dehydrogenase-like [Arctopsyche grandis]|uniref:farnesol dehydrogenase-like n=1 Tax=Arctopsyche grandis TaxID=121162 RepID=UPI00406D99EC
MDHSKVMGSTATKVAVVTGASSGIGASTALALAAKGYVVVAIARRLDKMKDIAASSSGTIHPKACDITVEEQVIQTFEWISSTLGGLDVLVNCVGVLKMCGVADGDVFDWKSLFDTNVIGVSLSCREALKYMRSRGDNGNIININSIAGHYVPSNINFGMYAASKHALTALTESLRYELLRSNSGIRVTSISPGTVHTPMAQKIAAEIMGLDYDENVPLGTAPKKSLEAQDVTDAILYVLSTPKRVQITELTIQPVGQIRA